MKKLYLLIILFDFLFFSLHSQQLKINGKVTDTNGQSLPGVSVVVSGTTNGVITDTSGYYTINNVSPNDVLEFSFLGYLKENVKVADQKIIDMRLVPDLISLNEVVVIGYGIEKRSLVTGAISKVQSDEIIKSPSLRAEQAIQGRTAGVLVSQTSGQPGAGFTVRVRGTGSNQRSEPIYIVDGMRMGGIENININDIESIEILKDAASAAIYGAQGANGVVLITTKTGVKGESRIDYRFYYGWQEIANKKFSVMNSHDYLDYRWRALLGESHDSAEISDPAGTYHLPLPGESATNTDWFKEIFKPAPMFEHNLSFSGGNDKVVYMVNGSYFSQDGIAGGGKSNFTRYSARFNADYNVKKWLKLSNKLSYNRSERTSLPENSIFNSFMNMGINMDPLTPVTVDSYDQLPNFVKIQHPDYVVKNGSGKYYGISDYVTGEVYNPLALLEVQNGKYITDRILGSLSSDISLFKGFVYTSKLDFELAYGNNNYWSRKTYYNLEQDNPRNGVNSNIEKWSNLQWGNILSYNTDLADHHFGAIAGIETRNENYRGLWASGSNMIREEQGFALISTTVDSLSRSSDALRETKWVSYFGRLNYNYLEKYILSLTFRADGSSLFGPENRFGYFPSVSLGWMVSEESFWKWEWINKLKLRASWGQNGSTSNLAPFQWAALITENYQYPNAGGSLLPAAEPAVLSNPNLKWETSEQLDLGADIYFFNNRVSLMVDYYRKITRDLLTMATSAYVYGNYNTYINAGDVLNSGVEIELGFKQKISNFDFSLDINGAYNYNEVLNTGADDVLEGTTLFQEDGPVTKFEKNYPVWYFSGYVTDGIFQTDQEAASYKNVAGIKYQPDARAGDVKFKDVNKDGTINSDDRIKIGDPNPDWLLGTNISIAYKNIDLGIFMQGAFGHQIVNAINRSDRFGYNKPQYYFDKAWTGEGSTNEWFRPTEEDPNGNLRNSDLFVENADYLRIKNVQLGYNLNKVSLFKDFGLNNARIYASVQNLLTITGYNGLEPEIGSVAGSSATGDATGSSVGIDYGFYPISRIYQFGINVSF